MVPFYIAVSDNNEIQQIDASIGFKDGMTRAGVGGSAYTGKVRSLPMYPSVHGGTGKLSNVIQNIESGSGADVKITPWINGIEETSYAISVSWTPGSPTETEYPFYLAGKDFRLAIEISNFSTEVELGGALAWVIPSRLHG